MCALTARRTLRERIEGNLRTQIEAATDYRVQLLIEEDDGRATVGAKRNRLLERAQGRFACFVDDDDDVSPRFVAIVAAALAAVPHADVVELRGAYYVDGRFDRPFHHSLQYTEYGTDAAGYFRPPNHLNPVRTALMRGIGFEPVDFAEDYQYAMKLRDARVLWTEAPVSSETMYYDRGDVFTDRAPVRTIFNPSRRNRRDRLFFVQKGPSFGHHRL